MGHIQDVIILGTTESQGDCNFDLSQIQSVHRPHTHTLGNVNHVIVLETRQRVSVCLYSIPHPHLGSLQIRKLRQRRVKQLVPGGRAGKWQSQDLNTGSWAPPREGVLSFSSVPAFSESERLLNACSMDLSFNNARPPTVTSLAYSIISSPP